MYKEGKMKVCGCFGSSCLIKYTVISWVPALIKAIVTRLNVRSVYHDLIMKNNVLKKRCEGTK